MTKRKSFILVILLAALTISLYILVLDWLLTRRRHPENNLTEFASNFKHGKIYFEAINQEVDIGSDNYFRDDGTVEDIDIHCRKLRFEIAGLNILPLEEIDLIKPEPRDFVEGFCLTINIKGKKFVIIFYESGGKTPAEILAEKVHEETHALIRLGKINLVKNFLRKKNISVEYNQAELYRLCKLDPNKKHLLKKFSLAIKSKGAALEEFLAQKMREYYKQKLEQKT